MRALVPELGYVLGGRPRRNLLLLLGYCVFLALLILAYAWLFQYLKLRLEQEEHSFATGVYWTITTMTTLGFGDITFVTDAGRLFSGLVTLSGFLLLLIILPFAIISLIFAPWLERQLRHGPRLRVHEKTAAHVILCGWDAVTKTLASNLAARGLTYVAVTDDYEEAVHLGEQGFSVVYGVPTDAEVLERVRVETARMVVANLSDPDNANLLLTVQMLCSTPVVAVVTEPDRTDLMKIAGASRVVALREILGGYLAVRATTRGAMAHVVDSLGDLLFAEIPAHGTPFVGLSLKEARVRETTGASVIGIWERGRFSLPDRDTRITDGMVMLLVGTATHLEALERLVGESTSDELVLIVGHGTVGCAAADLLDGAKVPYVIVDRELADRCGRHRVILGDASQRSVLEHAGVLQARGLIVTTNDDGVNIFLTLAGRHLNPHIRIVARANREENVAELYAAGADFVVSHASVGASILGNMIEGRKTALLSEGVHIFWRHVPTRLHGVTVADSRLRSVTGATVIAVQRASEEPNTDVHPHTVLESDSIMILVGTPASEAIFSRRFRE